MWRLAWRNLWRNRVRTAITGSAISLTLAFMFAYYGTSASSYGKMKVAAARAAGGNVLVHARGYWESQASDMVVRNASALRDSVAKVPGVAAAIPRIILTGLVSSARGNAGVRLLGVDRALEASLVDNAKYVAEDKGTFLEPDASMADRLGDRVGLLVLSKDVVEDLRIELGDRVVVTATDPAGEVTRIAFRLTGIADTGSDLEGGSTAWTALPFLQRQMGLDDSVTQIGVIVRDDEERAKVKEAVLTALAGRDGELEVLTWDEAIPEMVKFIRMDRISAEIFGVLIFLVVAFGIANTFLMAVMERVRELGVLGALGMTPSRVAGLVVCEAILLSVIFSAVALLVGFGIHSFIAAVGIDFSQFTGGGGMEVSGVMLDDMIIYSEVEPGRWLAACLVAAVLIVLSASYPAFKATRMDPAQAMRTYE